MQVAVSPVAGFARATVSGYTAPVDVNGSLTLHVNGLGGGDTITAGNGLATLVPLVLDGGDGDDIITGSDGADVIYGGAGTDTVTPGRGSDLVFLGDGNDVVIWNPGDGNDTIDGEGGSDTLNFNGANIGENIAVSPNGSHVLLTRDVASITMDLNGIEVVNIGALGGADQLTVNDLTGTDVTGVNIDLGATGGVGDGQADTVTVNGTGAADTINLTAVSGTVSVTGLAAQVKIAHPEAANDTLVVNGLGGVDSFSLGAGVTSAIGVVLNQ
jgi:Ca2+-binding RTX toxin-like protein